MPWTPAQHRLFEAAAHNPEIARRKGIKQSDAARMAAEGVKKTHEAKLADALREHIKRHGRP